MLISLVGCGSRDKSEVNAIESTPVVHVSLDEIIVGGSPQDSLFLVTDIDSDSTGKIFVLDSQARRLYSVSESGEVRSIGREGPGPGEFNKDPVYLDATDSELVVTVGGSDTKASFFTTDLAFIEDFRGRPPVTQTALTGDGRVVSLDLRNPVQPKIQSREGNVLGQVKLNNGNSLLLDSFTMEVTRTVDGHELLVIVYTVRNRVQVVDLTTLQVISDFRIPGLPDIGETRENPVLDMVNSDNLPYSIPKQLPDKLLVQSFSTYQDKIYILSRDYAEHPLRDIYVMDVFGTYHGTVVLSERASAIHMSKTGELYAAINSASTVARFVMGGS